MKIQKHERRVYLDNAASTPIRDPVRQAMLPYLETEYGNPSSLYTLGLQARKAVEHARKQVAAAIHAKPEEIYFTSGGSESDSWAIKGTAFAHMEKGGHIITSSIEHHAVLNSCKWLERLGFSVTYLPVDSNGMLDPKDVEHAIRDDTILISIMTANNEIGTIQPIAEIGRIARKHGVLFHTDAVQAVGAIAVDVERMNVDMLSISGHKFHAPKGIGALYIRNGVRIDPLIHGGQQEGGLRAGTENVASIAGFGKAIELATQDLHENSERIMRLRDLLWNGIRERIPNVRLNGHPEKRLAGNLNILIPNVDAESLLLALDSRCVAVSAGSACMSGFSEPSHVLKAIGLTDDEARCSLRMTVGDTTKKDDVEYAVEMITRVVREMQKLW